VEPRNGVADSFSTLADSFWNRADSSKIDEYAMSANE
jgi:hypothetical protein